MPVRLIAKSKYMLALCLLAAILHPVGAGAEFYSYEDRSGTIHFVEDPGSIPKEYRQKKQIRKDKYDDLPESVRQQMLESDRREREEAQRSEAERSRTLRFEKAEQASLERQRRQIITPVTIIGRQVFVPVLLTNGSTETETMLLLDTGATSSVISPEVAARLKIDQTDNAYVKVVGGRVLKVRKAILSKMQVGPIQKGSQEVVIISQRGGGSGDGLLGMSFLAGFKYTIDFDTQTITWMP
jgi:predicted aspartyl protease